MGFAAPGPYSRPRKSGDALGKLGILCNESLSRAAFVVGIVKTRGHGGTKERKFPPGAQSRTLPEATANDVLRAHACGQVGAQNNLRAAASGMQFQHFDRIAEK